MQEIFEHSAAYFAHLPGFPSTKSYSVIGRLDTYSSNSLASQNQDLVAYRTEIDQHRGESFRSDTLDKQKHTELDSRVLL